MKSEYDMMKKANCAGRRRKMIGWLIASLVTGVVAGYAANRIMGRDASDLGTNLLTGLAGSIVGSIAAGLLGLGSRNIIGSVLIAVFGACLALWLADRIRQR